MQTARAIYQHNLDCVSRALLEGDLATMLEHLALPHLMVTDDTQVVIASPDELLIGMNGYREYLAATGVTSYSRVVRQASFVPSRSDLIVGRHDSVILRDGQPDPVLYPNRMTLMRIEGRWMSVQIEMDGRNADNPVIAADMAQAQRRDHDRRSGGDAG